MLSTIGWIDHTFFAGLSRSDWPTRWSISTRRRSRTMKTPAIAARAMQVFSKFRDARIFAIVPPAVQELGAASGFDMELVDDTGIGHEKLVAIRNKLLGMASQDKTLAGVRPNALDDAPLLNVNIDHDKARALGLDLVSMAARTRA